MFTMVFEFVLGQTNDSTRSLSPGIENISIRPVFSKLPSKQPNNFPPRPKMTQNPLCSTLATAQPSSIERPPSRVTHNDVYNEMTATKPPKRKLGHLSQKNHCSIKTPLNIAYQLNTMSHEATKLPKNHTKSTIVNFNQTLIQRQHRANQSRKI